MHPLVPGKARKASSTQQTFRKQPHGPARPGSKPNAISLARKSTDPSISQNASPGHNAAPDTNLKAARKTQSASRLVITSRPYAIAGVAGFHRGAKPPATGLSQLQVERRLKPAPHKNVGDSRTDHGSRRPRDMTSSSRRLDHGSGTKSRARRTTGRAVTQASSSIRRDLLLPNQHRNQVNSALYANIVFGGNSSNKNYKLVTQSSSDEENTTPKPANNVPAGRALGPASAGDDDAVWKTMIAAFGALSLSTVTAAKKRRLPYLRRNVRTSFLRRCQMMGLAVNPVSPQTQSLTILYKIPIDVSENEWDDEVTEYAVHKVKLTPNQLVCPLCDILGRFITREMLEAHLKWDHRDVETIWRKRKNGSWELVLELPGDEVLDDEWEEAASESSHSSSSHPSVRPSTPVNASRVSEIDHGTSQAAPRETTSIEGPIPFFKFKTEHSPTLPSRTASLVPDTFRDSQKVPSARDPLGALGTHPRLSSSVDDDNDSLLGLSCRPCGPRLYDATAKEPISKYGLTSWSLLERDEELFEIDDVRDEEKAMQALWNRWIFFERRHYLLDPRQTVIEYLEAYKCIIMEAAGWKGVRVWLLLLAKHKYLTGDDVVTVMTHYESLADIGP
ncbi:hypothetical protein V8E52_008291 [Russula decolorans]